MKYSISVLLLFVGLLAFSLIGCGGTDGEENGNNSASEDGHDEHNHSSTGDTNKSDMDKMKEALANLSPEDAASAEAQHICPVSGEMLGTMGMPLKVEIEGRSVWICCEGCRTDLLDNPDEYLTKLDSDD